MWHLKQKVLAYITRTKNSKLELLIFSHRDFPAAGLQIPAGTVDPGENIKHALRREVKEESGIDLSSENPIELGVFEFRRFDRYEIHERHVFHIPIKQEIADHFQHSVTGHGEDLDMIFNYEWVSLSEAAKEGFLAADQGLYLKQIKSPS